MKRNGIIKSIDHMVITTADSMYKVQTYENLTIINLIWDDKRKQMLSSYVSDFDQTAMCELYEAVKQIKNGTIPSYGLGLGLYSNKMDKDKVVITYNDGLTKLSDTYTLAELEEMIDIYCDEFKRIYNVDLREVSDEYEPLIEGIIDPDLYTDERVKRFSDED